MKTARPTLVGYRDEVTALMEAGESFGVVEDAIDESAGLTQDAKAALWLFAFAMRDRAEQLRDARTHLDALA
jgi:O-succinylbenzoate synthase